MGSDVVFWTCFALFVGPVLAGIGLVILRYQFDRGTWWSWALMLIGGFLLYRWLNGPNSPLTAHPTPTPIPTPKVHLHIPH